MTIDDLFDFNNPNLILQRQTAHSIRRPSGTVPESVKHGVIYTQEPNVTIHHTIIGASPHPDRDKADKGWFYMVAYVSIPLSWFPAITKEFADTWDVSFVGPTGAIQKFPPVLRDIEMLVGERLYVGFDWFWLRDEPKAQPSAEKIKARLLEFVSTLRSMAVDSK